MEIKNYIKNGYLVTNKILNEDQIISLREEINKEFIISGNQVTKKLVDFKNITLVKKIISLYNHPSIQGVLKEIEKNYDTEVALLQLS